VEVEKGLEMQGVVSVKECAKGGKTFTNGLSEKM